MTTFDLLDFSAFLWNAIVCLVMGLLLVILQVPKCSESASYRKIRVLLAHSSYIKMIIGIVAIYMLLHGKNYLLLNQLFTPLLYFIQVHLIFVALFRTFYFHERAVNFVRNAIYFSTPVAIVTITYLVCFLCFETDNPVLYDRYRDFVYSLMGRFLHIAFIVTAFCELLIIAYLVIKQAQVYQKYLGNFFTGETEKYGQYHIYATYGYIAYLLATFLVFVFWTNPVVCFIAVFTEPFLIILVAVAIIWEQNTYFEVCSSFHNNVAKNAKARIADAEQREEEAINQTPEQAAEQRETDRKERRHIEAAIQEWIIKEDKPYLREGITLAKTAEAMDISSRALSDFINSVYHMNFNTWINSLRVEEIKEILKSKKDVTMMELAFLSGFTDQSAMSKVFKRIVGETPSAYKRRIQAEKE